MRWIGMGIWLAMLLAAAAQEPGSGTPPPGREAPEGSGSMARGMPPRWSVGLGVMAGSSPYRGVDAYVLPLPLVAYNGERLYWFGPVAGYKFVTNGAVRTDLTLRYRFSEDLGADSEELEGVNERDGTVQLGVRLVGDLPAKMRLAFEAESDILGRHEGAVGSLALSRAFRPLPKLTLTPSAGVNWESANYVDYYFGVGPEEVAADRPEYEGDAVLNFNVDLMTRYTLGRKWSAMLMTGVNLLGDAIEDSPLVDQTTILRGFVTLMRAL